jgi:hypothetical protein
VGGITIYVAANAANGNNDDSGDHIYTTSLKLTAAAAANQPTITAGGVVSAGAFRQGGIAPGTWIEIFGSNLSTTTRAWESSDFDGADAPKSLDGVTVTIGGKSAYVDFVSRAKSTHRFPTASRLGRGCNSCCATGRLRPILTRSRHRTSRRRCLRRPSSRAVASSSLRLWSLRLTAASYSPALRD